MDKAAGGETPKSSPGWQKYFFDFSSRLTRYFPRTGSWFLNLILLPSMGSSFLIALSDHRKRKLVRNFHSFRRFLVVPDCHIGDAVMSQSAATAIRDFFPGAEVDYVVNKTAFPLIEGNPDLTRVIPFFSGAPFISAAERSALRRLMAEGRYDLCLNFSPFLKRDGINPDGMGILDFITRAPVIVSNERSPSQVNHFIYQTYAFTREWLSLISQPVRTETFKGVRVTLSDSAADQACRFASEIGLSQTLPVVFYNPDTAYRFTCMPFDKQADLLNRMARLKASVLLGEGHSEAGIGLRLKEALSPPLRSHVRIVPAALPLEVYAALIDLSDVFVSGDTGPLHVAAARRYSRTKRFVFRNRTAVLSFFGATPSRMSGYDSCLQGYLPANQDAPSWCYTAGSPCRNITCLNKMFKTCRTVRCFEQLDIEALVGRIDAYLGTLTAPNLSRRAAAGS
jgi:ADP-heptose:LPS heptosyltransferase